MRRFAIALVLAVLAGLLLICGWRP